MSNNRNNNNQLNRQELATKQERRRQYDATRGKLFWLFVSIFGVTFLVSLIALIITLSADVVYIHNTGMSENHGREVWVGGVAFIKALFSGKYSSTEYDNLAVPFYYYAKEYCPPTAIFTFLTVISAAFTTLVSAGALLYALLKKDYPFSWFTLIGSTLTAVLTIITYAFAVSMTNGNILSGYCNNNPACSIRSDLIWCVVISVLTLAANIFAIIRFIKLEKIRKTK